MEDRWRKIEIEPPPQDTLVMTKIDDNEGERNVQSLTLRGRLWWATDMYVYYTPTHWKPIHSGVS